MEDDVKNGTVKWFHDQKGYGFITVDNEGKEVFVHYTGIVGEGFRRLAQGQRVTFRVTQGPKGPQAVDVRDVSR